jgi:hypothetical protein
MEINNTASFGNFGLQIVQHHIFVELRNIKLLIPTFVQFLRIYQLT